MNRVVVIAPHADDEILGCGASIAKHVRKGDEVTIIIATNAHIGAPEVATEQGILNVRKEARESHSFLGVKETIFYDFPAPALNAFPEYKISLTFSEILKNVRPTILYIPHHGDIHQDHKAIHRAALVAARPQGENKILSILSYETLSETEWAPMHEKAFIPNCFVDVSDTFDMKLKAFSFYKSQIRQYPHSRSTEALEALAKYRGATIGVERAEAFVIERQIGI
jgi:LmbE family N-acetylglucosaminyl deacetylase